MLLCSATAYAVIQYTRTFNPTFDLVTSWNLSVTFVNGTNVSPTQEGTEINATNNWEAGELRKDETAFLILNVTNIGDYTCKLGQTFTFSVTGARLEVWGRKTTDGTWTAWANKTEGGEVLSSQFPVLTKVYQLKYIIFAEETKDNEGSFSFTANIYSDDDTT